MNATLIIINGSQSQPGQYINEDVFKLCAAILVAVLVMLFILFIFKMLLEHSIKRKIIEKGISEELAASVLSTKTTDNQFDNSRWFMVLAALAIGLILVWYTSPLGIHSLAILAFSLALGFLAHYLFIKYSTR